MPKSNTPIEVGLTGGIAAGKSLAAEIFKVLSVPVFNADTEAKTILETSAEVRRAIIERFGEKAYSGNLPNRPFLADRVFKDESSRKDLNAIVHPAVGRTYAEWVKVQSAVYVIKEAAITFETGMYKQMDRMILVTAPEEVRLSRAVKRDGSDQEKIENRMRAQWSDEKKIPLSDFLIHNDGQTALIPQVLKIHKNILSSV
ncbi:MAG: dephospho-CoA kinase [Cryomorphaceae bacterium]